MSFLQKIQSAPQQQKLKILWGTTLVVLILLIAFWILVGNGHSGKADTGLFKSIYTSIKDFKNR